MDISIIDDTMSNLKLFVIVEDFGAHAFDARYQTRRCQTYAVLSLIDQQNLRFTDQELYSLDSTPA